MNEHPPVTNCGFGYLSSICVVALIGLVLFSVVARNYKYRERDDRPYDQRFVVDFYSHDIKRREIALSLMIEAFERNNNLFFALYIQSSTR